MIVTIENHVLDGGISQIIKNNLYKELFNKEFLSYGYPNQIIEHGSIKDIEKKYRLDTQCIYEDILKKYT